MRVTEALALVVEFYKGYIGDCAVFVKALRVVAFKRLALLTLAPLLGSSFTSCRPTSCMCLETKMSNNVIRAIQGCPWIITTPAIIVTFVFIQVNKLC